MRKDCPICNLELVNSLSMMRSCPGLNKLVHFYSLNDTKSYQLYIMHHNSRYKILGGGNYSTLYDHNEQLILEYDNYIDPNSESFIAEVRSLIDRVLKIKAFI